MSPNKLSIPAHASSAVNGRPRRRPMSASANIESNFVGITHPGSDFTAKVLKMCGSVYIHASDVCMRVQRSFKACVCVSMFSRMQIVNVLDVSEGIA
jgi:hypothetical protein